MDRCGNEIKHNYTILWNICGEVMEKVSIYFYKGMEKVVEMKSNYLLRRYYKYKRFYQHGYSLQREIVKVDSETNECSFTCKVTNSVYLCSDRIQDIAKRVKEGDTFYVAESYVYPNLPKYYR